VHPLTHTEHETEIAFAALERILERSVNQAVSRGAVDDDRARLGHTVTTAYRMSSAAMKSSRFIASAGLWLPF
jgi:hypothetical protein